MAKTDTDKNEEIKKTLDIFFDAKSSKKIQSIRQLNINTCTQKEIVEYFKNTWSLTETLFNGLKEESAFYQPPSHQLRHPLIFYYCHPAVFYINKLRLAELINEPINAYFEQLFEIGVDEMSWDDLSKNQNEWPSVAEIKDYRSKVYQQVTNVIQSLDFEKSPISIAHPAWALLMSFEHERIHFETSSVLVRELPIHLVRKPLQWPDYLSPINNTNTNPLVKKDFPDNIFVSVEGRKKTHIGKKTNSPFFGWDNEYGTRYIAVDSFKAKKYLTSNGEFWDFVKSGGYSDPQFWSEEGWKWRTFRNAKWPTFWIPDAPSGAHHYKLRLCFEIIPMQWDWPVIVNYHEAKAFCLWLSQQHNKKYRLLTEAEHHCIRDESSLENYNINFTSGSESSVDFFNANKYGFCDVFGNVWQWCEDHFAALPGFKEHPFYDDFSSPCFDGKHNMIMGGSFISTGGESNPTARFHFRRHFFQQAGFRIVEVIHQNNFIKTTCMDAPPPHVGFLPCCSQQKKINDVDKKYEDKQTLNQYLLLHYGTHQDTILFPSILKKTINFPTQCAQLLFDAAKKYMDSYHRALDLGCAVGKASFELARHFDAVVGVDLSKSFIATAKKIKRDGKITFSRKDEGFLSSTIKAKLDTKINRSRVKFRVADAASITSNTFGEFDAVLISNLLCRLPDPKELLLHLSGQLGIVRIGGIVLITSPYSWLTHYTPVNSWLGGHKKGKKSAVGLKKMLQPQFKLLDECNIPFVIQEHERKFELIISHATLWQRKK